MKQAILINKNGFVQLTSFPEIKNIVYIAVSEFVDGFLITNSEEELKDKSYVTVTEYYYKGKINEVALYAQI